MNQPLVSVIMVTYNRAALIGPAIESVLAQSYRELELLIVDDASTDETATIADSYAKNDDRIKYHVNERNLGISRNRNRGLEMAQGDYIAVLDSDDVWVDTDKLARQVDFLEQSPDHVLVGSNVVVIDASGRTIDHFKYETDDHSIRKRLLARNQFTHSSLLFRRATAVAVGGYDESLAIWEDFDLILKMGTLGQMANLKEETTAYRKHGGNISNSVRRSGARVHLAIMKRHRNDYPNYWPARLKGWARFLI